MASVDAPVIHGGTSQGQTMFGPVSHWFPGTAVHGPQPGLVEVAARVAPWRTLDGMPSTFRADIPMRMILSGCTDTAPAPRERFHQIEARPQSAQDTCHIEPGWEQILRNG
ncbi:MAG: hypothetical protein JW751_14835 [Polyangiaceae bacterium]|nr:hypothetical protein [Polyangiaceae bacterium]